MPSTRPTHTSGRVQPSVTYRGKGTWYAADDKGGSCLYDPGDAGDAFAALSETDYENARMCGAYLEVTGPKGTTTVKIVNECPCTARPARST